MYNKFAHSILYLSSRIYTACFPHQVFHQFLLFECVFPASFQLPERSFLADQKFMITLQTHWSWYGNDL